MGEQEPFTIRHLENEAMEDSGSEQRGTQTGGVASGGALAWRFLLILRRKRERGVHGNTARQQEDIKREVKVAMIFMSTEPRRKGK